MNYAQNRKTGTAIVNGHSYTRQPKLTRMLVGKPCQIGFGISNSIAGEYVIIDANDLQPSHLGASQNPLHFIPEAQPRNRSASQSGALTPERIAQSLRPAEVMEGATAYTGAPVINQRGEVIQGNGRAYMLKVYYAQFPGDERGYKKTIAAQCECLGFKKDTPAKAVMIGIVQPVVCRMVAVNDLDAIRLGQFTQADTEAITTETTKLKAKARLLTAPVLARLVADLISRDTADDSTLAELIRAGRPLQLLISEGVIRPDDLENYTRAGAINESGVQFVSNLLLQSVFRGADVNTPDALKLLPVALQTAIQKSTLYLLRVRPGKTINAAVSRAIIGYRLFQGSTAQTVDTWLNQYDLTGNTPRSQYSPLELALIRLFADMKTQREVVQKFRQYSQLVSDQPATMFTPATPGLSRKAAIEQVFGAMTVTDKTQLVRDRTVRGALTKPRKETKRRVAKPTTPPGIGSVATAPDTSILAVSKLEFGRQQARQTGKTRITEKSALAYADAGYQYRGGYDLRIRRLLEDDTFATGLALYRRYETLRAQAHPDAYGPLVTGLLWSAKKTEGNYANYPFVLKDPDATQIRTFGANKSERIAPYFSEKYPTSVPTPQQRAAAAKAKLKLEAKALDLQLTLEMEMLALLNL